MLNLSIRNCLLIITFYFFSLVFFFNHGFDFTDEGYVYLISMYPSDIVGRSNHSGYIGNLLLTISSGNIFLFRLIGFLILIFSTVIFFFSFKEFNFKKKINIFSSNQKIQIFLILILSSINYYKNWVITPSYNLYNLITLIVVFSILFKLSLLENRRLLVLYVLALSFFCFINFLSKPTTFFLLLFLVMFWMIFFNKKNFFMMIFFFSFFLSIFFLTYISLTYGNYKSLVDDLHIAYELKTSLDPRYNLITNFNSITKQFAKNIFDNHLIISTFIVLSLFSKFYKKIIHKDYILCGIILYLFFSQKIIFTIFLLFLFYLFFEFRIINLNKINNSLKIKLFLLVTFIFTVFSYCFGTNTNAIILSQKIFLFSILIIIFLINIIHIEKKIINSQKLNFLVFFVMIFTACNIYNNFHDPMRMEKKIYNYKKKIDIWGLKSKVIVGEDFYKYSNHVQKIFEENGWKTGNYLLDFSGRQPGLLVILGAKFVIDPWIASGYAGSNSKAKKVISLSEREILLNSWIVTANNKFHIDPNVLKIKNLSLTDNYEYFGSYSIYEKKLSFWKPKN